MDLGRIFWLWLFFLTLYQDTHGRNLEETRLRRYKRSHKFIVNQHEQPAFDKPNPLSYQPSFPTTMKYANARPSNLIFIRPSALTRIINSTPVTQLKTESVRHEEKLFSPVKHELTDEKAGITHSADHNAIPAVENLTEHGVVYDEAKDKAHNLDILNDHELNCQKPRTYFSTKESSSSFYPPQTKLRTEKPGIIETAATHPAEYKETGTSENSTDHDTVYISNHKNVSNKAQHNQKCHEPNDLHILHDHELNISPQITTDFNTKSIKHEEVLPSPKKHKQPTKKKEIIKSETHPAEHKVASSEKSLKDRDSVNISHQEIVSDGTPHNKSWDETHELMSTEDLVNQVEIVTKVPGTHHEVIVHELPISKVNSAIEDKKLPLPDYKHAPEIVTYSKKHFDKPLKNTNAIQNISDRKPNVSQYTHGKSPVINDFRQTFYEETDEEDRKKNMQKSILVEKDKSKKQKREPAFVEKMVSKNKNNIGLDKINYLKNKTAETTRTFDSNKTIEKTQNVHHPTTENTPENSKTPFKIFKLEHPKLYETLFEDCPKSFNLTKELKELSNSNHGMASDTVKTKHPNNNLPLKTLQKTMPENQFTKTNIRTNEEDKDIEISMSIEDKSDTDEECLVDNNDCVEDIYKTNLAPTRFNKLSSSYNYQSENENLANNLSPYQMASNIEYSPNVFDVDLTEANLDYETKMNFPVRYNKNKYLSRYPVLDDKEITAHKHKQARKNMRNMQILIKILNHKNNVNKENDIKGQQLKIILDKDAIENSKVFVSGVKKPMVNRPTQSVIEYGYRGCKIKALPNQNIQVARHIK